MDLNQLNGIARVAYLPTIKFKNLEENTSYQVSRSRKIATRFGTAYVAELDRKIQVFLPSRVVRQLEERNDIFENLIKSIEKRELVIKYLNHGTFEFNHISQ